MAPASFLQIKPGDRVLDLCAAPGGKTTQLALAVRERGLLVSNDISASRAKALVKNIELFGLKNVVVHYIGAPEEAIRWAREAIEPVCGRNVAVVPVSPVIGLHVGPAVGVAYECERPIPGKLSEKYPSIVYAS